MIESHEIKNVTDFNVADSVRRDIKVLVTKTRYTVSTCCMRYHYFCKVHHCYRFRIFDSRMAIPVVYDQKIHQLVHFLPLIMQLELNF